MGRTPKADPNARQYYTFAFWPAEAVGLRFALQAQMGLIAFGIPRERAAAPAGARPAAPGPFPPPAAAGSFAPPPAPVPPFGSATAAAPADDAFGDAF